MSKEKWKILKNRPFAFLLHAFAGGAIVAFGATLSLSISAGISTPGLQNLVMGLVFGFSLVAIMMTGMSLITAEMALGIIGVFHKKITIVQYILFVIAGYIGNALGSLSFMSILAFAGGPFEKSIYALRAHALAASKTGMNGLSIFLLGILCTWFLQTAMFMYLKAKSDVGKMAVAYYGPFAFVGSMIEHAIANIGFIALPLGGNLIILISIKWFHSLYPNFSEVEISRERLLVKDIMLPATMFPDKTRTTVNSDDSIISFYPLFLKYD